MYFVYILYSETRDRYYIGQTDDIGRRLEQHNSGRSKSTKAGVPWELRFQRKFETRGEAVEFESFIKSKKRRAFIEKLIADG